MLRQLGEETNHKTAQEINCKCAIRKVDTPTEGLDPGSEEITKSGAKCSAEGNNHERGN